MDNNQTGLLGRLRNAIIGILFGLLLFAGSFVLLWWNEGSAVKDYKTIGELGESAVKIDSGSINPENDGKPVVMTALATTETPLTDPAFGVQQVALRLQREVEMYQWEEDKKTKSGNKSPTYTYDKVWSERLIDSGGFHRSGHNNPQSMAWSSTTLNAQGASFGAFKLGDFLTEQMNWFEPLTPENQPPAIEGLQANGNGYYVGANPGSPEIGDYRIEFSSVLPQEVTLLAVQMGSEFVPYTSPDTGRSKSLVMQGNLTTEAMVDELMRRAVLKTWLLRGLGFVVMGFGLLFVTKPLAVMADVIPVFGNLVGAGLFLASFLLSGILSMITIAIAWVAQRPSIAIILGVAVIGLTVVLFATLRKGRKPASMNDGAFSSTELPPPPPPVVPPAPPALT